VRLADAYRNLRGYETMQRPGRPAGQIPFWSVSLQAKARFIRPVIVAAIMAFLMTAVITFINLGLPPDFLRRWMIAYAVAWPFATVAAFVAVPIADRMTKLIIAKLEARTRTQASQ
jgi:hypothetical protein